MKTLWIINHYACKPDEGSGSRHYDIASVLAERGYRVLLFAASYNHFSKQDRIPGNEKYVIEGVKENFEIIWLRTSFKYSGNGVRRLLNMLSFFWAMLAYKKSFPSPDIVVGSSVHLFSPLAGYIIAKGKGARFLTEIRDIWPLTLIELGKVHPWHPVVVIFSLLEKYIYKHSDAMIATMPGFNEYCKEIGVSQKIYWIPNGYKVDDTLKTPKGLDQELFWGIRKLYSFICIYSGSHGVSNHLDVILDAASNLKEHKDIGFVMIGDGPDKARIVRRAKVLGLEEVHFLPRVTKDILGEILKQSDAALVALPNSTLYRYGISLNKLNDYLFNGCPVVLSGDSPENPVIRSNGGVCVPPDDSTAMAVEILRLRNMTKDDRMEIGNRGRKYILEEHDFEILADRFIDALEDK